MRRLNPHLVEFEEFSRVPNARGTWDAVLARVCGSNMGLYLVPTGKSLHGHQRAVVFIHVTGSMSLHWLAENRLNVVVSCEAVSDINFMVLEEVCDGYVLQLPKRK